MCSVKNQQQQKLCDDLQDRTAPVSNPSFINDETIDQEPVGNKISFIGLMIVIQCW